MFRLTVITLVAAFIGTLTPGARAEVTDLPRLPGGTVTQVVDGDTVFLATGDEVRMVGIQAPKLPLGRKGFQAWPLAEEARVTLQSLVSDRVFNMHFGGVRYDRHNRVLAHLVDGNGFWLQGEMLRLGLARVYSFPDNTALVEQMLSLESQARENQFGIWSHPFYAIRTPDQLGALNNTFQLVEGTIVEAARVRSTVYLNFGENWQTDFTVMISRATQKRFLAGDPADWTGKRIRVRGWIKSRNGPMIVVSHPEQIEMLDSQ